MLKQKEERRLRHRIEGDIVTQMDHLITIRDLYIQINSKDERIKAMESSSALDKGTVPQSAASKKTEEPNPNEDPPHTRLVTTVRRIGMTSRYMRHVHQKL